MPTLLVVGFLYRTTADAAAQDVLGLEPGLAVETDAVVVVSCDEAGALHVTTNHVPGRDERRSFWQMLLAALIFLPRSPALTRADRHDLARRIARLGLDEDFQDRLREMVVPESSALLLLVDGGLPVDALTSLGRFGGRLLSASLVPDAELRIRQVIEDGEPAAWSAPAPPPAAATSGEPGTPDPDLVPPSRAPERIDVRTDSSHPGENAAAPRRRRGRPP